MLWMHQKLVLAPKRLAHTLLVLKTTDAVHNPAYLATLCLLIVL